ncbi:hypothetical protein BJ742DRAFT_797205 [Cladochytrium replicatum]|nr:hypothetical protein BJ742DRAFT_797205 [Cladochytrium replicatum]
MEKTSLLDGESVAEDRRSSAKRPLALAKLAVAAFAVIGSGCLLATLHPTHQFDEGDITASTIPFPLKKYFPSNLYPPAHRLSKWVDYYFGTKFADPFRWLEDPFSDETLAFTKAQNKLARDYISALPDYHRFKTAYRSLTRYDAFGSPFKKGEFWYYTANFGGKLPQPILYRASSLDAPPEVFFDPNTQSPHGVDQVDATSFSPDLKTFAFLMTKNETDYGWIGFIDVETKKPIDAILTYTTRTLESPAFTWAKDGSGVVYTKYFKPPNLSFNDAGRNNDPFPQALKIQFHEFGSQQYQDILCIELNRADFPGGAKVYSTICSEKADGVLGDDDDEDDLHAVGGEVSLRVDAFTYKITLPKKNRMNEMIPTVPLYGEDEVGSMPASDVADPYDTSFIGESNGLRFYKTAAGASNYQVISVSSRGSAMVIIPETEDVLDDVHVVGDGIFFALYMRDATHVLRILANSTSSLDADDLPEKTTIVYEFPFYNGAASDVKADPDNGIVSFTYSNLVDPGTVYVYYVESGKTEIFRKMKLPKDYKVEQSQVFFNSTDGAVVPMFLVRHREAKSGAIAPAWLTAYGGFNVARLPTFTPFAVALAHHYRPATYALVNIRGGKEYGQNWYYSGRNLVKQHCFDDMIAAAKTLIDMGYTAPGRCGINGGSNGGLLTGAVSIQAPHIYGAGMADYGVHETLRYTNFTFGEFWTNDYGKKNNATEVLSASKWSPVYNVFPLPKHTDADSYQPYPALLITTGDHDTRVSPLHSYKLAALFQWAARVMDGEEEGDDGTRGLKAQASRPALLRIRELSGHNIFSLERKVDAFSEKAAFWAFHLDGSFHYF